MSLNTFGNFLFWNYEKETSLSNFYYMIKQWYRAKNHLSFTFRIGTKFRDINPSTTHWFLNIAFFSQFFFHENQTLIGDCGSKSAFQTIILAPVVESCRCQLSKTTGAFWLKTQWFWAMASQWRVGKQLFSDRISKSSAV